MILGRMVCLALVCLALGVSGEAPQSPWQSLNPKPHPVKQTFDQGQAIAQLALTMEEEILVEMLPFKPPFKMDKKQMAVVIKLLKKAVKPILKSERLQTMVSIVDDFIQDLEQNQENKKYYKGMLNAAQDVYGEAKRMYNSEEAQGRTFETVTSLYRESVLNNYIVSPLRSWVISPITDRLTYAVDRMLDLVPSNTWLVDTDYINPFTRWTETFEYYVNQFSNWSARGRSALEATARLLEEQDLGRSCSGCGNNPAAGGSVSGSGSTGVTGSGISGTEVQVIELSWVLPTLIAIASVAAVVAAAGGVGAAISIPLGIIGGLGGFTGPATGPTLTVPVFTGTGVAITGTATNFAQGRIGRQDTWYAYDRPEHIIELVETFDDSVLDESDWGLGADHYVFEGSDVSDVSDVSDNHLASTTDH